MVDLNQINNKTFEKFSHLAGLRQTMNMTHSHASHKIKENSNANANVTSHSLASTSSAINQIKVSVKLLIEAIYQFAQEDYIVYNYTQSLSKDTDYLMNVFNELPEHCLGRYDDPARLWSKAKKWNENEKKTERNIKYKDIKHKWFPITNISRF